jgi:hypothetical protein
MDLNKVKAEADKLSKNYKEAALNLLTRMEEVVEGIGDEPVHWKPQMIKLVQATTDRSSIPKGTTVGDFVLGEAKVEHPLKFIPLRIWEGRQYWSPDPNENKLLCSSPDGKLGYIGSYCNQCPHQKFNEETRKSECSKTQNVLAITPDLKEVFITSFAKTNYQTGLELKTAATKAGVALYRRTYALTSKTNKNYKNVENFALEMLDEKERNTPAELLPFLKEMFDAVTEDRKTTVDKFHELILSRKNSGAALPAPEQESNTVMLSNDSAASEGGASTVSDLAKNYQV